MQGKGLLTLGLLVAAAPVLGGELAKVERPTKDNNYIVVLNDSAVAEQASRSGHGRAVDDLLAELGRAQLGSVRRVYRHALRGGLVELTSMRAAALARDPRVALVEKDSIVSIDATQNNATWGLDRIDQRDRPLSGTYTYDSTASNVHAYIIDTGIRTTHNDFGGRASSGWDFVDNDSNASDCNGHGTHVAGTVGGATWGVAKAVRLHAVRVLDCSGSGTNSGVIAGIDWVTQNHVKPAVANMSLGGGVSTALDNALRGSIAAGVTYAVAAGNENTNACNGSPSRVAEAITVGSSTSSDARSSFSNYGTCLDLFAPGSSITSAWYSSNSATNTISGTSMASPHVAGAAALYLSTNTNASPAQVASALVGNASTGKLSSIGSGSPNRLLFTTSGGGGGGGGGGDTQLSNNVPVNVAGASGSQTFFYINVPSGATSLAVTMAGGSGDGDLYVRFGSKPTLSTYSCRPYLNGNNESCSFNNPSAGTWWIMVNGYSAYSGASLTASYVAGGGGGGGGGCSGESYTGSLSGAGDSDAQPNGTYYQSGAGTHQGVLDGPSGTDFDLRLRRWNGSSWVDVATSLSSTSHEEITYNGSSGYYYWRIESYSGSGSYTFCLSRP